MSLKSKSQKEKKTLQKTKKEPKKKNLTKKSQSATSNKSYSISITKIDKKLIVQIDGGHLLKKRIFKGENINPNQQGTITRKAKLLNNKKGEAFKENAEIFINYCDKVFNPEKEKVVKALTEIKGLKKTEKLTEKLREEISTTVKNKVKKVVSSVRANTNKKQEEVFNKYFSIKEKLGIVAKAAPNIPVPEILINRIQKFIENGTDIKYLVNFWHLCLLNPNPDSRDSLFKYVVKNGLTITPSGYVLCYRRLIKHCDKGETYIDENGNSRKAIDTIYTDNYTHKMRISKYDVVSIPREECDERQDVECSSGLHVGNPDFVGSYSNFGSTLIMCLVSPQHWVAVPYTDAKKARVSEYYFFREANIDEIKRIRDNDLSIFDEDYDDAYRVFEESEIWTMLKNAKIRLAPNSQNAEKLKMLRSTIEEKLKKFDTKLLRMNEDFISNHLDPSEISEILTNRIIKNY